MGIVTDHLIKLIQRQVDDKGLVLWCDPEGHYAALAAQLTWPDTRLARFNGSYLALRREIDDALNRVDDDAPPRLVVYHPAPLTTADHALDELVLGGVVMQPGGQALPLNTKLEVVARQALKPRLPAEAVEALCEQIRKGQIISLAELDQLADKSELAAEGALALIFDTAQPAEVALAFLNDDAYDTALTTKKATPQLAALLSKAFGATLPPDEKPDDLRARLGKHLLITEFRATLGGDPPATLATVPFPQGAALEACLRLVREWRDRRDLQDNYVKAAQRVESDYALRAAAFDWQTLHEVRTFPFVEEHTQTGVETALRETPTAGLLGLAETHLKGLWAERDPTIHLRWALIAAADRLLTAADRILNILKTAPRATAADYLDLYTQGPEAWCQLDTEHRLLERLAVSFDFDSQGGHNSLELLLAYARRQYSAVLDALAQKFVAALAEASFTLGGLLYQTEVFQRHVAPAMKTGKTAYVLVDALRYEMARDLVASLNHNWRAELLPAIATAPTVTPVGMASLLPGAELGVTLVDAGRGKLGLEFSGRVFKERKDRVAYLESQIDGFCDVKLEDLAPARKAVRDKLKAAKFILVTSQEIDLLGEGDNLSQAREFMDSALSKLARAFRVLADSGAQHIIVAADHGYIFAEELDADRTLPAPGGQTADLHRRVWVGKGGQAVEGVLRASARQLNLGGDLELATPYGLACFPTTAGRAYFHGGLTLQELIIPVLVIQPAPAPVVAQIEWTLTPGSKKLSTRFLSVTVGGQAVGIVSMTNMRVRLEVQVRNKSVSSTVSASYGFSEATGEVEMRPKPDPQSELEPNTIMVMVVGEIDQKTATVVLIDAQTEQTLAKQDIESAIAI